MSPSTIDSKDPAPETDFYIPATGPTRLRRNLKHDDTFAVVDSHGDIGASAAGSDGIFLADTRYASCFEFLLNGMQPLLLGSNMRNDNSVLTVDLMNPDIYFKNKLVLHKDVLHIVRTLFLWRGIAYQRFGIQNHGDQTVSLRPSFAFSSDFANIFEVRSTRREHRGVAAARMSYHNGSVWPHHNGSVWPHDNAMIALGFARNGLPRPIERVFVQGHVRRAT